MKNGLVLQNLNLFLFCFNFLENLSFSWDPFRGATPILAGLPHVKEISGKNKIFSRSGKSPGILKKCQGILAI